MLCENCGENEANVRYTQIINGVKKEMHLCEDCAKEKGINTNMDFNIPINFSSFLGDIFDDYNETGFLPEFTKTKTLKCSKCGLTYDEFINNGKFGCENCYNTFEDKIDYLVKNLHGSSKHIGRKSKFSKQNESNIEKKVNYKKESTSKNMDSISEENKLEKLQRELKEAIKDERYEDAAKIRDEIKKLEK